MLSMPVSRTNVCAINEDGYNETVSATCALTNSSLDYMYYISFDLKSEYAFPKDCPLKDVEVIPI